MRKCLEYTENEIIFIRHFYCVCVFVTIQHQQLTIDVYFKGKRNKRSHWIYLKIYPGCKMALVRSDEADTYCAFIKFYMRSFVYILFYTFIFVFLFVETAIAVYLLCLQQYMPACGAEDFPSFTLVFIHTCVWKWILYQIYICIPFAHAHI